MSKVLECVGCGKGNGGGEQFIDVFGGGVLEDKYVFNKVYNRYTLLHRP
jgi:hypothetical protein